MKIHHLGIAVADLAESIMFYRDSLGLELIGEEEVPEQKVHVAMFRCGESRIELLAPMSPESPIAGFLEKKGPGLHHLAIAIENIESEIIKMAAAGVKMIDEKPRSGAGGHRIAFVHPKSTRGVLLELVE
ncbi:MAG: methylmalonyl-CoA epimerase [Candidatus Wallbacteria bacterium]|nr:methylmalonyl-CoA epimerase [Candidatus Wallbacteria bacterium]